MIDQDQINEWVKKKTITKQQAKKMLVDVERRQAASKNNKLILTASIVGSLCLGIAAILFIASNWTEMSNFTKMAIMLGSTFGAYVGGYHLSYVQKNFKRVGASLLFLGALLFGATIILATQIYHINANSHTVVLLWLVGILPLVYVLKTSSIAALAAGLFMLWMGLFMADADRWWDFLEPPYMFFMYGVTAILLFALGGVHYQQKEFHQIARVYRLAALKVLIIVLFFMSFDVYDSEPIEGALQLTILALIAGAFAVYNWQKNPAPQVSQVEGPVSLGLIALFLLFVYAPLEEEVFVFIANLVLAGFIGLLVYAGYMREDSHLVNMGMFWLVVFLVVKYFDWFWDLLDRSLFFLIGGIILVVGGMTLEKKRRKLLKGFS